MESDDDLFSESDYSDSDLSYDETDTDNEETIDRSNDEDEEGENVDDPPLAEAQPWFRIRGAEMDRDDPYEF